MKLIPVLCGAVLLSSTALTVLAEEIGYIDLTEGPFRESSRHPRTMSGGCGGGRDSSNRQVSATLLSLDRAIYRLGDEVTFEIKVRNTGKDVVIVPWTPHLGDLEPVDPDASYKYLNGGVVLAFSDPEGREFLLSEFLYGAEDDPETLRELLPGQWFTVRGRQRIEPNRTDCGQDELQESGWVDAKVSAYFVENSASYSPENGGSSSETCIPMRSTRANELVVTLEHR